MDNNMNVREIALEVLIKVDKQKSYSNLELNKSLSNVDLSREDTNFLTEIVYGTIQRLNTIDWILQQFLKTNISKLDNWVKNLLRISIYQIWYLDRVPDHAIVNEAVNIAKKRGHRGISSMVNGVLRNILRNKDNINYTSSKNESEKIALEFSHPEWLIKQFINDYGIDETRKLCKSNNNPPFQSIRVNNLKISTEEMLSILKDNLRDSAEISRSILSDSGIRIKSGGNLALTKWYREGLFTIQDESSMLVANILDPRANMTILDAAAAPGGKTTHIAEKMLNEGRIVALDLHEHKIELIRKTQKRLGFNIIEPECLDARNVGEEYDVIFDRILLDAPCSGLGVIRRKPEIKWTKTVEDIKSLIKVQKTLLEKVSEVLKPGGVLVYSTCTISKEENQNIINSFIKDHPEFELDINIKSYLPDSLDFDIDVSGGMVQILPHNFNTDGFFISRMIKSER